MIKIIIFIVACLLLCGCGGDKDAIVIIKDTIENEIITEKTKLDNTSFDISFFE